MGVFQKIGKNKISFKPKLFIKPELLHLCPKDIISIYKG